jgi:hypothetical protein
MPIPVCCQPIRPRHDLAEELTRAEGEGTLPQKLALDRVWITGDGHAKLLDFPAPGLARVQEDTTTMEQDPARFLQAVAGAALRRSAEPVPFHARPLITGGTSPTIANLSALLRLSIRRPARVTRLRRFGITAAVSAFPILVLSSLLFFTLVQRHAERAQPRLTELATLTAHVRYLPAGERREQLRRHIAHEYRGLIEDEETWRSLQSNLLLDPARQRLARASLADYPAPSAEEIAVAAVAAKSVLDPAAARTGGFDDRMALALVLISWIAYAAIPALLLALIAHRGVILRMLGVVVVDDDGARASRGRACWRILVCYAPFLLGAVLATVLFSRLGGVATAVVVLTPIILLVVWSHLRPARSLQDRLAGTWLVPK